MIEFLCILIYFIVSDLFIAYESPKLLVVNNFKNAVALYCVSSLHSTSEYCWSVVGDKSKFPSTPVLYVNKGGLYQCTVSNDGQEVHGKIITVRVDVGK